MRYDMAPMEGITTYIYRNAHAHHFGGVERYYTPFLSPHKDKTLNHKELQDILPEHNKEICVIPQVLTASAEDFLKTVRVLDELGYTQVNLNCGCPSATVTSKHKGAGILEDTVRLNSFLEEIFDKSPLPISIKTRIGMRSADEWEEILAVYRNFPIAELIIHPRVRQDFYSNIPDWEAFSMALEMLPCPVCYNGDIFTIEDGTRLMQSFPALQACMLGRGLITDPALAKELAGGKRLDKTRLRAFHDEVYEGYQKTQSGEKNVLYRMKELWSYMSQIFTQSDKYRKKIQKAERLAVYESAVNSLFREQEIIDADDKLH